MTVEELKNQIFVGVVEDNNDPKRLCRIKVRVFNIFDDIPVEDMPWSVPWKDLGGNEGGVPEVGKVVSVVFDCTQASIVYLESPIGIASTYGPNSIFTILLF